MGSKSIIVATILAGALYASADSGGKIPFPVDYRKWTHVKSVLVGPASKAFATEAGIHHIYANNQGMEGYRTGKFPDGSMVAYDLLETKEVEGNTIEGARRRFDVMVKNSRRYGETGGWGFASFKGDNRADGTITTELKGKCFACHTKATRDSVFSEFRK